MAWPAPTTTGYRWRPGFAGALVLRGDPDDSSEDGEEDLNVKAVLLDTAAAGVAVNGAVILAADGWYWLDPAVALLIAVIIGYNAQKLVRKVIAAIRA